MTDFGIVTDSGTIRFERLLPGPIERLWAFLTEAEQRRTWLAAGPMQLWVGGRVELHFRHADLSPLTRAKAEATPPIVMIGRVTCCEPPRRLAYTWAEATGAESEVTFELSDAGDRVRLVLTHRRLDTADLLIDVAGGWHTHLRILADRLAGRDPAPFQPECTEIETVYRRRFAAA